jgi:hypothetical protein
VVAEIEDLGAVEIVNWRVGGGGGGENDGKLQSTEERRGHGRTTCLMQERDEGWLRQMP